MYLLIIVPPSGCFALTYVVTFTSFLLFPNCISSVFVCMFAGANFPVGNSIQEDYAPMGRGLTVGMHSTYILFIDTFLARLIFEEVGLL